MYCCTNTFLIIMNNTRTIAFNFELNSSRILLTSFSFHYFWKFKFNPVLLSGCPQLFYYYFFFIRANKENINGTVSTEYDPWCETWTQIEFPIRTLNMFYVLKRSFFFVAFSIICRYSIRGRTNIFLRFSFLNQHDNPVSIF